MDYKTAQKYFANGGAFELTVRTVNKRRLAMLAGTCLATVLLAALNPAAAIAAAVKAPLIVGAVGAWTFYFEAKKYLMTGDLDLDTHSFRMTLHTSASNANTNTLSTYGSLTGEIGSGNGYSSSGKTLTGVTWTIGTGSTYRFNANSLIWTATGGQLPATAGIKFAVISDTTSNKLLCRSQLTTAQFTLAINNTLTIAPSATGIFQLT